MNILGISGSLREASTNTRLLRAAARLAGEGVQVDVITLEGLPLYNMDLEGEDRPAEVVAFTRRIQEADALLFATPEYNYGIPGVLKNAVDWASRPVYGRPLKGKPVGLITASPGFAGGVRAQGHLQRVLSATQSILYPHADFAVPAVHEKINAEGELTDETTRDRLKRYLDGFAAWAAENGVAADL